ncbi:MAG: hypothetical protein Kow0067_03320 [Coriobacteriia bacterium]
MPKDFYCLHSELCKTLASEKRQRILGALRDRERTVSEIVAETGMSQANTSQHLAILRAAGVVRTRREGTRVYYAITNPKIIQAFDLISEVLQETLADDNRAVGDALSPSPED